MGNIKSLNLDNNYSIDGMWALNLGDLFEKNSFIFSCEAIPGNLELSEERIFLDVNWRFNNFQSNFDNEVKEKIKNFMNSFVVKESIKKDVNRRIDKNKKII